MNLRAASWAAVLVALGLGGVLLLASRAIAVGGEPANPAPHFPDGPWESRPPEALGLDVAGLTGFAEYVGGRGVVIRHGYLAHAWGDIRARGDVASAVKPVFTHFLFQAVREGRIASLDERVGKWMPQWEDFSAEVGSKDRTITWRHFATQTSCYGLRESPGTAFAYNDWSMALFIDLLFNRVYGLSWPEVDAQLLRPLFRDTLGCEDDPTFLAFAGGKQPGRLAISPRDFARLGWLYRHEGRWRDRQVIPAEQVREILGSPLSATFPRAGTNAAPMLPGQRTLGSRRIPDNQTEHFGSYSYLWWVNGIQADGQRHWPDAPTNTFAALGHGGLRALVVMPGLDLVVSWNDARINSPEKENEAFRRLVASLRLGSSTTTPPDRAAFPSANSPSLPTAPSPTTPTVAVPNSASAARRRVIIETDAGGDPDDEQSLVRFLLYANEWDVEGIVANRPRCRDGENRNPERTGLGVVNRLVDAYAACWPSLVRNDPRYPRPEDLRRRVVPGYDDTDAAVQWLMSAVDREDPRPLWYSDWGSDHGSATNNLRRALDRVLAERGPEGYARFKGRLRLNSADKFADHTWRIAPAFPLWVDTWGPTMEGRRWYHRFSALTSQAGGFDVVRDVLTGHGPLGALYPTNTTHPCKEGDTLSFLYLVPNGLNAPDQPEWGGWGGRLAHKPAPSDPVDALPTRPYFHASVADAWNGSVHRDHTLGRWAVDLQNDFRARLRWCVASGRDANHPPQPRLERLGTSAPADRASPALEAPTTSVVAHQEFEIAAGEACTLSAARSTDPDGDSLQFDWVHYPEAGTWRGAASFSATGPELRFTAPDVAGAETVHFVLRVRDSGQPALARYARAVFVIRPRVVAPRVPIGNSSIASFVRPPSNHVTKTNSFRSLLRFYDGRGVNSLREWAERRGEIRERWHAVMGAWPPLLERPKVEFLRREMRENFEQRRVKVQVAPDVTNEGWLLVPSGPGPYPAVFVPYYEPETSIGRDKPLRDFALQLARRGFVTLALGSPGGDARLPDTGAATCQPLSFLAYYAANAATALAQLPEVDPTRLGIVGHSYGGKWALFGASLCDRYACGVWSDPGIVWDESRSNVNYWEAWYLGRELATNGRPTTNPRRPGIPSPANPRTGAYARLVADGNDLHEVMALMAPRPFLVSGGAEDPVERWSALDLIRAVNDRFGDPDRVAMTLRPAHDPTPESNERIYDFFELYLKSPSPVPRPGAPRPTDP